MKKISLILSVVFFVNVSMAQVYDNVGTEADTNEAKIGVLDAIRKPIDGIHETHPYLASFKPMDLAYIRMDDILYSKLIWSVIDLREKFNHPLYFPTEAKGNWKSLMQAIIDATTDSSEANPNPLRVYNDEYLTEPYAMEGLQNNLGQTSTEQLVDDWGNYTGEVKQIFVPWGPSEVFQYHLKDQYIIDKSRSVMEPRLLAVAPMFWYEPVNMAQSYDENSYDDDMPSVTPRRWRRFGWLYFKEMRPTLAVTDVFNTHNTAQRRTYDDIFMQRHFSSSIRAEENVHNNREISLYVVNGMDQRLEADKIKEGIRYMEHDMWEF